MSTPDLSWFKRRWNLPETGKPLVEVFLQAERNGSTAFELISASQPKAVLGESAQLIQVGDPLPDVPKPLVALAHGKKTFIQSWLYYRAEMDVAADFKARLRIDAPLVFNPVMLGPLWDKANPEQKLAVSVALAKSVTLLTGGPGTGKTFTLTLILLALSKAWTDAVPPRVLLAAPTGKAADQMRNSIQKNLAHLHSSDLVGSDLALIQEAAAKSKTLHKLLEYNPSNGKCKFNTTHPLPCDLLIVDESSMTDLLLWRALLKALPKAARMIVVGDPHQLQSVGPGNVLGELVRVAGLKESILEKAWVHLVQNMRFKKGTAGIANLAKALEDEDSAAAVRALQDSKNDPKGLHWIERNGDVEMVWNDFPESIQTALTEVAEALTPEAALQKLQQICILTALRHHFIGAQTLNDTIARHFARKFAESDRWPARPIIINRNDPETGLKNGTVGVIVRDEKGETKAWFRASGRGGELTYKEYPVAKLPDYSPAWVLTVHRSQGSEYEQVLVILPRQESPMNSRELIYTAITRAQKTVYIAGSLETVKKAVETSTRRVTMLGAHLAFTPL